MLGAYNLQIAPYFVIYKQDINKKLNINEISVGYLESSGLKKILWFKITRKKMSKNVKKDKNDIFLEEFGIAPNEILNLKKEQN